MLGADYINAIRVPNGSAGVRREPDLMEERTVTDLTQLNLSLSAPNPQ